MIIEVSSHECVCVHLFSPADAIREFFFSMFAYFHVVGRKVAGVEEGASLWPRTQAPGQLLTLTWS